MFKLPKLQGHSVPDNEKCIVYFSCDYDYFDRHGFALQQSINNTVSWIHVHCHIINEGNMDTTVLDRLQQLFKFTYSYENVDEQFYIDMPKNNSKMKEGFDIFKTRDVNYIARRTYLASVRFMRFKELFTRRDQNILQIDCDSILRNGFHRNDFEQLTMLPAVMPKPKDKGVYIASALSVGTGDDGIRFRQEFSDAMIKGFENGCYWFIDQDILKSVANNWANNGNPLTFIGYKWNAWGLKRDEIFSTGKGKKKNDIRYLKAQYRWLPKHWKEKLRKEVQGF